MRNLFLINILLTFIWAALTGNFSRLNFLFGFSLSYAVLWSISRDGADQKYFKKVPAFIGFILFFLKELFKANLQVAYDVITPKHKMEPGIVAFPLSARTDLEISLLSNIIGLTPGTLGIDVSDDKKVLYIHAMYIRNKEQFIQGVKDGFEKKLLQILR